MDPDEARMRSAAHLMVSSLAGSLALVTCKDPLRVAIANHLRALLAGVQVRGLCGVWGRASAEAGTCKRSCGGCRASCLPLCGCLCRLRARSSLLAFVSRTDVGRAFLR